MRTTVYSKYAAFGFLSCLLNYACIQKKEPQELKQKVELIIDFGMIGIQLSDETPIHRDNFIKLTKEGFFDGILWHRVIDGLLIQTGDATSKDAFGATEIGAKDVGYYLTAEFKPHLFHKRGAINTAHLDQNYTVFGEVIEGMHVVDSIAKVKTRVNSSRPVKDVRVVKAKVLQ